MVRAAILAIVFTVSVTCEHCGDVRTQPTAFSLEMLDRELEPAPADVALTRAHDKLPKLVMRSVVAQPEQAAREVDALGLQRAGRIFSLPWTMQ